MWLPSPILLHYHSFSPQAPHSGWARKYITGSNLLMWLSLSSHSPSILHIVFLILLHFLSWRFLIPGEQANIFCTPLSFSCTLSRILSQIIQDFLGGNPTPKIKHTRIQVHKKKRIHNYIQNNEYTNTHKKRIHKCTNTKSNTFSFQKHQHPCLNHRSNVRLHCLSVNQRIFHSRFLPHSANNNQSFNSFTFNFNTRF